uniref:Uncharacterized protein LOC104239428 n=1 Tax=Nicotiana sylvestris TaxID=4096 RepID=A0A1U7XRU3_NICSY|nr:PREDICTED: uncharacterized protein LOC104239428 [Nicotiana sylvestris]
MLFYFLFCQVENKLGCFNLSVLHCSGYRCSRICYIILIFNRREHPCSDHRKYSCFSLVHPHILRQSDSSIYEFYLHLIRDTAFDKLYVLRVFAASSLCHFSNQIWDESYIETAKVVSRSNLNR